MTFFICTCGTSIASERAPSLDERIAAKIARAERDSGGDLARMLHLASAETNGLARSDCGPADAVLLLASDTTDGQATAAAVKRLVTEKLGAKARVRPVAGLQVGSAQDFRQSGIRNLIRIVRQEAQVAREAGDTVVFNVTGGFKAVVPYLTLLGMFGGIDVHYVYDQSDQLIRLPALPLSFDEERVAFALPALQALKARGMMPDAEFRAALPGKGWNDDPIFAQLIEEADGLVALSGAGELALAAVHPAPRGGRLLLHRRARQSGTFVETVVQRSLGEMTDPVRRAIPAHSARYPGKTDMLVWKELGGSAPRIFYWVEDDTVWVAEILPHAGQYETDFLDGKVRFWKNDYGREQFEEHAAEAPACDSYDEALAEFLRHNEARREELAGKAVSLQHELDALREQHGKTRAVNAELRQQLDEARARQRALEDDLGAAREVPAQLLAAAGFAAHAHRAQRRKDADATPYVNHVLQVAQILAEEGEVRDCDVLLAGLLHDTIEDTGTTAATLTGRFGRRICALVEELTDDKSLDKQLRKDLQVEHAGATSHDASLIKTADKIANLRDLVAFPPADWPEDRRRGYFVWAKQVVDGLPDGGPSHQKLKAAFVGAYERGTGPAR